MTIKDVLRDWWLWAYSQGREAYWDEKARELHEFLNGLGRA
jgi:hypothetical protein